MENKINERLLEDLRNDLIKERKLKESYIKNINDLIDEIDFLKRIINKFINMNWND